MCVAVYKRDVLQDDFRSVRKGSLFFFYFSDQLRNIYKCFLISVYIYISAIIYFPNFIFRQLSAREPRGVKYLEGSSSLLVFFLSRYT